MIQRKDIFSILIKSGTQELTNDINSEHASKVVIARALARSNPPHKVVIVRSDNDEAQSTLFITRDCHVASLLAMTE